MNYLIQKTEHSNEKNRRLPRWSLLLSMLLMFSLMPSSTKAQIKAETVLIDGLYYDMMMLYDANIDSYYYEATVTHGPSPYEDSYFEIPEYVWYNWQDCKVTAIGEEAFFDSNLGTVVIPSTVTSIGARAFDNCKFWSLEIPNSVTTIGDGAFYGCRNMQSITLPENLTKISKECFAYCSELYEITIPESVSVIGEQAFECSGLKKITLPSSLTTISERAFHGCSFKSIVIPKSVTEIQNELENPFPDDLKSITVEEGNPVYDSREGCNALIKTATNELIRGFPSTTIPNTVTKIGCRAFRFCPFSSIVIPNSVTSIGAAAFSYCSNLTSVTLPESLDYIESGTFTCCSGLSTIDIPNSVTSIGASAFLLCSSLKAISIPNSVTSIASDAFSHCSSLKAISIPSSVTNIGSGAFAFCTAIESIVVDAGNSIYDSRDDCNAIINTVENSLVAGCKNTVIHNSVTSIGHSAFRGMGFTSFSIPNSVTSIGNSAFSGCSNLSSITVPNSVTNIDGYAFYGCKNLGSFTIPDQLTTIKGWTFYECGIRTLTIGKSVNSIEADAFIYCGSLQDIYCYTDVVPQTDRKAFEEANLSATVHVKKELVDEFESESPWYNFSSIVPLDDTTGQEEAVTDISSMDNTIYILPFSGSKGSEVSIPVRLKNADSVTSYGFELVLPEGMSITTDGGGSFDNAITLSTRHHSSHVATTNKLSANTYKIVVSSLSSKSINGNEGEMLSIKAQIAESMIVGDYIIKIQEPLLVSADGTKPTIAPTNTTVTIESYNYVRGDVDSDGVVDLADAVLVINYYVGKPVTIFNNSAADVDGDGVIDLADAVKIINYYVGKIPSLARQK